jgi:protein involved in polysaccharide export with SLBB domain
MLRHIHHILAAFSLLALATPVVAQTVPGDDKAEEQRSDREQEREETSDEQQREPAAGFEPSQISDDDRASPSDKDSSRDSLLDRSPSSLRPTEPNEFEIYVEQLLGRRLNRFGSDLLLPSARDFARTADATIPPDYRINVGDTISISLTGSAEGSVERTVDQNGKIFLPSVGEITLAGVRQGDLKNVLMRAVGTQFRNFRVGVRTTELRGIRVFVTGFARNPGAFSVNSLTTVFNAVLQAGGPAAGGSFRRVKLIRDGVEVADIDLYNILIGGNRAQDAVLENEDVIVIPPTAPQIAIWGSVQREGIFELGGGESLAAALRLAGGTNELAETSRLILYRSEPGGMPGPQVVLAAEFATTIVRAGDIIQILPEGNLVQPIDRQSVLVRLEGEVRKPGNYFVAPNTPLSEVLAQAGGLTERAFPFGTVFKRQTIMAQQKRSFEEALDLFEFALATAPLTADSSVELGRQQAQASAARATLTQLRDAEPDGRLVLEIESNAQTLPGGLLLENGDRLIIPSRPTSVGVFGAVYRPASFQLDEQQPRRIKDFIDRAGGTIRAADNGDIFVVRANGSVLTRTNGALSARALPGDVVFVPVRTQSRDVLAKVAQVSSILFQFGLAAATVAAIN